MKEFDIPKMEKMMGLMGKMMADELTSEDISFMRNHLSTFCDFIIEAGTADLVRDGVDEMKARALLGTLVGVAKMAGGSDYNDFLTLQALEE
jgi:hypothetical protein